MWTTLIKTITNLFNSKIFLYLVIGGLIWFWISDRKSLRSDISRLSSNQIALTQQLSRELQLTRQDFQRIYPKEDSIMQLIKIKPKQIEQVVINNYHYKDSTTNYIPYKDSISQDTMKFIAPLGCIQVEGYTTKKGIVFTNKDFHDILHTFLYKRYDHKFLFIKWGKYIDAKVYSECKKEKKN